MRPNSTVLVVDDDAAVHAIITRVLELKGYKVLTASGGNQALAVVEQAPVDAVLVDKHMPGMNGFEVIQAVRDVQPNVAVVLMTAFPERTGLSALKLDGYLPKPFRKLSDITDCLAQALEQKNRRVMQHQLLETMLTLKHA